MEVLYRAAFRSTYWYSVAGSLIGGRKLVSQPVYKLLCVVNGVGVFKLKLVSRDATYLY